MSKVCSTVFNFCQSFFLRYFLILTCLLAFLLFIPADSAWAANDSIRVGILENQAGVTVAANLGMEITDPVTGELIEPAATAVTLAPGFTGVRTVDGREFVKLRLRPLPSESINTNYLKVNNKAYRGELEIILSGANRLTVINELSLEEYLMGVIAKEMPAGWPLEALKAQAVAARCYALNQSNRHRSSGFDVCATQHCQVYGGVSAETAQTNQAVVETAGEVLTYNGKIACTYFFSSSGGYTENVENVWGSGACPYLVGVEDSYDQKSPYYKWQVELTKEQVQGILAAQGINVGELIELKPIETGVSGRVKVLAITGSQGTRTITGEQMRSYFGLKSTLVDIVMQTSSSNDAPAPTGNLSAISILSGYRAQPRTVDRRTAVTIIGAGGKQVTRKLDGLNVISAANPQPVALAPAVVPVNNPTPLVPDTIIFNGGGYGHGVGMSQWGAYGMALAGYNYAQILQHYYQNTALARR